MILGTAGHIDHGKTTLVRALTGVDTDRLKEEKARGISIELGYAYLPLATGEVLGFIDVPGHERFVHTMAAGAAGIDHALVVVAADDGVMPQTREHVAILDLLGLAHATVALTKVDRVEAARADAVRRDIAELLAPTRLAGALVFDTRAHLPDDAGIAALLAHLQRLAAHWQERSAAGFFRLAVDRVFTLAGQGTIVTGTVFAGQVEVGQTLVHSASGTPVRVRSLHAQNRASTLGRAGQRCALNLAGIARETIARGDWIADPRVLHASRRVDVRLKTLPDAPVLKAWTPLHVHLGTAHHVAHLVPLDADNLLPGMDQRVQLVFDADVHTVPGDRLIVRNAQAKQTVGGGRVIDPFAPERQRRGPARRAALDALEHAVDTGDSAALFAHSPDGLTRSRLALLMGRPDPPLPEALVHVPAGADELLLSRSAWQALGDEGVAALERFHAHEPDEPGLNAARLARLAWPARRGQEVLLRAVLADLIARGAIEQHGAWLHRPGHAVVLDAAAQALADRLVPALAAGAYEPPWVRDLARDHALDEDTVRRLLRLLARNGAVVQVVKDLFYHADRMAELARHLAELAQADERGEVAAARFRDATGLGRKRAIQILEFFDRSGYTRRVRDAHVLRAGAAWSMP
jgi:selenocysteine-specific elongation factor